MSPLLITEDANQRRLRMVHRRFTQGKSALPTGRNGTTGAASPTLSSLPLITSYTPRRRLRATQAPHTSPHAKQRTTMAKNGEREAGRGDAESRKTERERVERKEASAHATTPRAQRKVVKHIPPPQMHIHQNNTRFRVRNGFY